MHGSNINEGQPQQTLCQWQQLCHITLVHLISRSCSLDKFTLNLLLGIVLGHFTIPWSLLSMQNDTQGVCMLPTNPKLPTSFVFLFAFFSLYKLRHS